MNDILEYKGFKGSVEFSSEDKCLHGKVLFINDLITYEADGARDLEKEFQDSVDDYLGTCEELGIKPEKSYSGSFNVRIGEDLHKQVAQHATMKGVSINNLVKQALEGHLKNKSSHAQR